MEIPKDVIERAGVARGVTYVSAFERVTTREAGRLATLAAYEVIAEWARKEGARAEREVILNDPDSQKFGNSTILAYIRHRNSVGEAR